MILVGSSQRAGRAGFTLIETMIVTLVGAILILSVYGVLLNQQRAYTVQAAEVSAQQTARAGMEILASELRSLSTDGGDITVMDNDTIGIRVMRKMGIACAVDYTIPSLTVVRRGSWFRPHDSVFVYADGDEDVALDDTWIAEQISTVDTTHTCGTLPAQQINLPAAGWAFAQDSVRVGAAVRSFENVWFGLGHYQGEPYLGRWSNSSSFLPVVGPLNATAGPALQMDFYDMDGNVTALPDQVARIDIRVRSETPVDLPNGNIVSDSLQVSVFTRN